MASATKPIHVLRSLLRHLKTGLPQDAAATTTASPAAATPTQAFVLQQYRVYQSVESSEEASRLRQLAADFLVLRRELKAREHLYELDASAETALSPKEMSRRAAARAGLQLPDLSSDEEMRGKPDLK